MSPVNFCLCASLLFAGFRNVDNTFATNRTLSRLNFAVTDPFMSTFHTYPFCHVSHFHSNISTFTLKTVISFSKRVFDAVSFFWNWSLQRLLPVSSAASTITFVGTKAIFLPHPGHFPSLA